MLQPDMLLELAGQYGTPLYVYDLDRVVDNYKNLFIHE